MQIRDYLLAELEREGERSRAVLKHVPPDQTEWKPHERSMAFGHLVHLVATIPTWIAMQVDTAELDVAPADGPTNVPTPKPTSEALLQALDDALDKARTTLRKTSDEHLGTNWRMLARGALAQEAPRYEMIQDTFNHWAHHRGQLTVYLRLLGATVAATYGPSADDQHFR